MGLVFLLLLAIITCSCSNTQFCSNQSCHDSSNGSHVTSTGGSPIYMYNVPLEHVPERPDKLPYQEELQKIHFSVKSTGKYHYSRLLLLLQTWFQTIPANNLHIITDIRDNVTDLLTSYNFNVHLASCPVKHTNKALACKCGVEFDIYYETVEAGINYNWYCHFDDDMYLNIKTLYKLLKPLDPLGKHYLGKWSVNKKERIPVGSNVKEYFNNMKRMSYYFATGAAYCISAGIMKEAERYFRGNRLEEVAKILGTPDDMAVGFIIESVFGYDFTEAHTMLSHLHSLPSIDEGNIQNQVTISYGDRHIQGEIIKNTVTLQNGVFSETEDPTRFLSYHCILYPSTSWCKRH